MEEMKKEYKELYNIMATSGKVKYMHLFGDAMTEMFNWFVANKPDMDKAILEKLECIEWNQYLTMKEANAIYAKMQPPAKWDYPTLMAALKQFGLESEEEHNFNSYALWIVISQIFSDFGHEIAEDMGMKLADVPTEKLLMSIYKKAMRLLKDADKVYDVRKYFINPY